MKILLVLFALIALTYSLTPHVTYMGNAIPNGWEITERADPDAQLDFRFNLHMRNLDILDELFTAVSTPGNPFYMQYLSRDVLQKLTSPSKTHHDKVVNWIKSNGIDDVISYGEVLIVSATVAQTESLLNTELYVVASQDRKQSDINLVQKYSLPTEISELVNFISGLRTFDKRKFMFKKDAGPNGIMASEDVISPGTMRNFYNIPDDLKENSGSQGVAEFSDDQSWELSDLDSWSTGFGLQKPRSVVKKGPFSPNPPDTEATLDIQMVTGIGQNGTTWYWTVDNWILELAQDMNAISNPPLVVSMSWGADERSEGQSYNEAVDAQYKKLALKGVTMIASSGDSGAGGVRGGCGGSHVFNPSYPAASAQVLSVGATMLTKASGTISKGACSQFQSPCAAGGSVDPANVPDEDFASGGGFSVFNPQPSWQSTVVQKYISDSSIPKPPSQYFNANHRGFPDVSAIGNNVVIRIQGQYELVGGTSCSAPIWSGMIGLINSHLLANNKKSVGFVNPLIYKMAAEKPSTFQSVGSLSTNNNDGCQYGYTSNPNGWDPVTGLGRPNFTEMMTYISANLDMFPDA